MVAYLAVVQRMLDLAAPIPALMDSRVTGGSYPRTCTRSGTTSYWSGSAPTCARKYMIVRTTFKAA